MEMTWINENIHRFIGILRFSFCIYLYYKDLGLSCKTLALVSFEHGCDVLDANLAIISENMIILAVAQEDEQKAVGI